MLCMNHGCTHNVTYDNLTAANCYYCLELPTMRLLYNINQFYFTVSYSSIEYKVLLLFIICYISYVCMLFMLLIFEGCFHTLMYQVFVAVLGCPNIGIRLLLMAVTGNMSISSLSRQILRLVLY